MTRPSWIRALAATFSIFTPLAEAGPLDDPLRKMLDNTDLAGAQVAAIVMDPESDRILASLNPDQALIPASNQKLLTSGAALITLGQNFAFRTELLVADTQLIIRGSGDPGLGDPVLLDRSDPPMTVEGLLNRLAEQVATHAPAGLTEIIADDRIFDREFAHPSWPEKDLNRWYCAEVAGLGFHTNVIAAYVTPAPEGPGASPRVSVQPTNPTLTLQNRARTIGDGHNTAWIARPRPENVFTMYGNVGVPALAPIRASIHEPPTFAAQTFRHALSRSGISVPDEGGVRLAELRETFPDAQTIAVVQTSIAEALKRCNTDSHNLYAEAMLKRIGHEVTSDAGSWSNGAAVVRMLLSERVGPDLAASVAIADGSGMSRDNRVSASTLAAWLDSFADDPELFAPFAESLATPGEGTLTSRWKRSPLNNQLRAKSGYLSGVYSLSGYLIDSTTGQRVVFALMINEGARSTGKSRDFLDRYVVEIDKWLSRQRSSRANALGG